MKKRLSKVKVVPVETIRKELQPDTWIWESIDGKKYTILD